MASKIKAHLPRLVLTLLLSAGLLLTLLFALDLQASLPLCLLICLVLSVGLEAISLSRRSALWGGAALAAGLLIWLAGEGARMRDLLMAFSLHLSGVPGALPLVADFAARVLAVFVTLLSFLSTRRAAGSMGGILLAIGSMLMLWLGNRPDLTPCLLPACAAALALYLMERHEEALPARILPWSAALVLLAFFLSPSSGLVVPEWKQKADEFRQTVMDRLFFTEPRDVFSLSSEGYYPQGLSQLGGPANPTNHRVMQVSTPKTVYLRGVMLNAYDGRSWRNTLGGRRYLWDASGMAASRNLLFDQSLPPENLASSLMAPVDVSVRMLEKSASTLFAPQRVRQLRAGGDLVPYFSLASELFITRNLVAGDSWAVSAPLPQAGDPGVSTLVEAASSAEDPQYEQILETYTALPSHLEEPVWQLASDVTHSASTPYEKAFSLQTWLSRNYRYTLDAAFQPADLDFVTNFLFNTREGYCTYFASAMTVLCRMIGLPARYVEGYLAVPDERGEAIVTGLDAHAWTEVYFKGFGWLTFDATPRRASSGAGSDAFANADRPDASESPEASPEPDASTPQPEPQEITPTPQPEEEQTRDPEENEPSDPDPGMAEAAPTGGFPWLLLLLLLILLCAGIRWRLTDPGRLEKRLSAEEDRFDLWWAQVLSCLSAMGLTRENGETPMSFTRRLQAGMQSADLSPPDLPRKRSRIRSGQKSPEASLAEVNRRLLAAGRPPLALIPLGECASLLHYGRVQAQPTDTALARDTALALKKYMPAKARLICALRRFFAKKGALPSSVFGRIK